MSLDLLIGYANDLKRGNDPLSDYNGTCGTCVTVRYVRYVRNRAVHKL